MALATHADLLAAIRDWLARPDDSATLPTERLADLVRIAEGDIYARLRVRQMETTVTLPVEGQSVALPADFLELRRLWITADPRLVLEYRAPPQFWREFASQVTGRPRGYTIEGDNLLLGPTPDASYVAAIHYYRVLPPLATALNSLFTAYPELFLYGALVHAAKFIGEDARLPVWREAYADAMGRAQQASDRAVSGAPLTIRMG